MSSSEKEITHTALLCASFSSKFMKIKAYLMICKKNKPAYPYISYVKITTSVKNVEHKNRVSLFKHLKINSLMESKLLFSYILVAHIKNIRKDTFSKRQFSHWQYYQQKRSMRSTLQ